MNLKPLGFPISDPGLLPSFFVVLLSLPGLAGFGGSARAEAPAEGGLGGD